MKLVGIVLKERSDRAQQASSVLIDYLKSKQIEYFVVYSREDGLSPNVEEKIPLCDLAVAFGGDGVSPASCTASSECRPCLSTEVISTGAGTRTWRPGSFPYTP